MTLQKVGYEGVWLFELAATDAPRRRLVRAQSARPRLAFHSGAPALVAGGEYRER